MKKIIVVGHKHSKAGRVFDVLVNFGLEAAEATKYSNIEANNIAEILCRGSTAVDNETQRLEEESYTQLSVSKAWSMLVSELFLANIDKGTWGWYDAKSIRLIEYWLDIDSEISIVLVYRGPDSVIKGEPASTLQGRGVLAQDNVEANINDWVKYNDALLQMHKKHPTRTILVNAEGVLQSTDKYIRHVREQTGIFFSENDVKNADVVEVSGVNYFARGLSLRGEEVDIEVNDEDGLAKWLKKSIVSSSSSAKQLFADLQAASKLPYVGDQYEDASVVNAWNAYRNIDQKIILLNEYISLMRKDIERSSDSRRINEKLLLESNDLKVRHDQKERECQGLINENLELNRRLKKSESRLQDLKDKLGAVTARNESLKSLHDENQALGNKILIQTKYVDILKRDLLRYVRMAEDRNRLKKKCIDLERENKKITLHARAVEKISTEIYGAADAFRSREAYQIGGLILKNSKSLLGLIQLPGKMRETSKNIRLGKVQYEPEKLERYKDFYKVEKIKGNLSQELGEIWIRNSGSYFSFVILPIKLCLAAIRFKRGSR